MRKNHALALSALILVAGALTARAVPIEGQTPDGSYQSVAVSTSGALVVQIGTGTNSSVTLRAPLPLPVQISSGSISQVALASGTVVSLSTHTPNPVTLNLSPAATINTYRLTASASAGIAVVASTSALRTTLENLDPFYTVYIGGPSVSTMTGYALPPGGSPFPVDSLFAPFQGALYFISSGTTQAGALGVFTLSP